MTPLDYIIDNEDLQASKFGRCLVPLLKALSWHGTSRQLHEALPYLTEIETMYMFRWVLKQLNYQDHYFKERLDKVDPRLFPCMFITKSNDVYVLLRAEGDSWIAFDGEKGEQVTLDLASKDTRITGLVYTFKARHNFDAHQTVSWKRTIYDANKRNVAHAIFLSLMMAMLSLFVPLYVMSVYDKVIGTSSLSTLGQLGIGMGVALAAVTILGNMRSRLLAIIGARIDREIGDKILQRLLFIAPSYTESASVGSQVARIKDFDRIREFSTGPLIATFFDLPFVILAIALIAVLGKSLVLIPLTLIAVFCLAMLILYPLIRAKTREAGQSGSKYQEFLLETIRYMRAIKYSALEKVWLTRHREFMSTAAMNSLKLTLYGAINNALSQFLMLTAGVAMMVFGAIKVMNNTLSVGAMIALMIVIWRILMPLKVIFNTYPRLQQIKASMAQINRLMSIDTESETNTVSRVAQRRFEGAITFHNVSYRYQSRSNPALLGVSFSVEPGEMIGIVGRNGAGKSTLLKLIMGMCVAQNGQVSIDHADIRQANPIELRNSISYLPQHAQLFHGTISANLRLAKPEATQDDLEDAAQRAGVLEEIEKLPHGFETRVNDQSVLHAVNSFSQRLCMARALLRNSSVVLLDEPASSFDRVTDENFMAMLEKMRGQATIILVTHRPSHLKMMDRILLLDKGQLIIQGSPELVLPKIPKEFM